MVKSSSLLPTLLLLLLATLDLLPGSSVNAATAAAETSADGAESGGAEPSGTAQAKGYCFGIDLGTTYSAVGLHLDGKSEIISNRLGNSITPSVVGFDKSGDVYYVGEEASQVLDPKSVIRTVKRIIGRKFNDPRVLQEKSLVKHEIVEDANGMAAVKVGDKIYTPEEISSKILENQIQSAHRYISTHFKDSANLKGVVITIPAYFQSNERNSTLGAGGLAGLNVLKLLSEPVAAAIANTDRNLEGNLVVVDIGGGTTDISVLNIDDGIYESLATTGDAHLGGVDFDHLIIEMLREQHPKFEEHYSSGQELFRFAEMLKVQLSSKQIVDYTLKDGSTGSLTRAKFNERLQPHMKTVLKLIDDALKIAELQPKQLNDILLVGGSARIPLLAQSIEKHFAAKSSSQIKPILSDQPDHAVTLGAALVAAQECGHSDAETVLISHIPFGLGVKALQGQQTINAFVIDPNSSVPTKKEKSFSTAMDDQPAVTVEIYQGFSIDVNENTKIGELHYGNLPKRRAGQVEIKVEFHIDENQIVTVHVRGDYDGAETSQQVIQLNSASLTDEEIREKQVAAERRRAIMEAILEFENKFSQAFYYLDSKISREHLDKSHISFLEETRQEWQQLKDAVYQNKAISDDEIQQFKDNANALAEKAEPVIQKVLEVGQQSTSNYDTDKGNDPSETAAEATAQQQSSSTTSPDL